MTVPNREPDYRGEFLLDHVAITVSNLARSIEFYVKDFGLSCERVIELPNRNGKVALLMRAGFAIEMFEVAGVLPLPDYRKTPDSDLRTIGVKHFALEVDDILGASAFLKRNDVEFISEVAVGVRGVRRFFVRDPDGIGIEITESPVSQSNQER